MIVSTTLSVVIISQHIHTSNQHVVHFKTMGVCQFSSVQFSHSVMSDSLQTPEPQHTRPPCPSPTPGVHPNSCPLSQWCHPTTSSSVIPFSSCPQSFPASVFSNESALCTRWPKYWSFSCNITMYHTAISFTKEIHLKYTLGYIFPLGFYSNIISTIVFYLHRTNENCFGNHSKTGKLTSTFTLLLVLS